MPSTDAAAREALAYYADKVAETNPSLAEDLRAQLHNFECACLLYTHFNIVDL